jgi:hypothetical protein
MYKTVHAMLGLPPAAVRCARGELPLPSSRFRVPFGSYGFPPALIPLWSESSGPRYFGYWVHWFVERAPTLVRLEVSDWYTAHEIARTFEQLAARLTLDAIVVNDGRTEGLESFARECGLTNVEEIDTVSRQSGDDPRGLLALPLFAEHPPAELLQEGDRYDGSFPWPGMELTPERLRTISTLETTRELRARIAASPFAPPWFTTEDQQAVFDAAMGDGDPRSAWMALNSHGWRFADAKRAIRQLAEGHGTEAFRTLAAAWTAEPHESVVEY